MTIDRRTLLVTAGGAALASGMAAAASPAPGVDASKSVALFLSEDEGLAPATVDRLPLEWHQGRAKALQAHLTENGFAGAWETPLLVT